jgi:hypothetical protein
MVPVATPGPLTLLWRWRYEVGLMIGAPVLLVAPSRMIGVVPTAVMVAAICLGIAVWPQARRDVEARFWCVVTPHRVRKALAEALTVTRRGKLPIILYTRPEPFGGAAVAARRMGTLDHAQVGGVPGSPDGRQPYGDQAECLPGVGAGAVSSAVQKAQRRAATGMSLRHSGHCFSVMALSRVKRLSRRVIGSTTSQ